MGISVTEIQTNLHIWACCNQIQQYSPFKIYAMWPMFNKMADDVPLSHAQTVMYVNAMPVLGMTGN